MKDKKHIKSFNEHQENLNISNVNEDELMKEIEDMAGEYAWVYNQERSQEEAGEGDEKYKIAKEAFIEGAKAVVDILDKSDDIDSEKNNNLIQIIEDLYINWDIKTLDVYMRKNKDKIKNIIKSK